MLIALLISRSEHKKDDECFSELVFSMSLVLFCVFLPNLHSMLLYSIFSNIVS